ncbi:MAG: S9 family peptidase [Gemmataceae bacterium]|nr:S9 family peptidase [Gemmataceae bacterium]
MPPFTLVLALAGLPPAAEPVDWPALTQKPHEAKTIPDPSLPPLLVGPGGEPIATKDGWEKARAALRDRWLKHLGPSPAKPAALDIRAGEAGASDGFTRRLVSFASEGDDRIRAHLLVPDDLRKGERRPAVVVFHETTADTFRQPAGLGSKPELALAVHLARRGYVALSPECPMIREPAGKPDGKPIDAAKAQAAELARRRPGWTGMGKMTFDAARCIDYLETRPEVDKDRVGCVGFSLGAKEVLYAVAFDDRYRAGVANEGGVGLRMSNWFDPWYLGAGMERHVPASEHHQLLALAAPRAVLVMGGGSADGDASWPFVRAALPVYRLYGAADRVELFDHGGKHTFPREGRRVAYRWLDHWLGHTPTRDEVGP